ncbi:2-C-methyl-D-erythritol 2,4-cyclodiphosphate synthase [Tannockella kyphosi]|uniref:2-C-methyl-D-erythritol 2,4-cyclodiphosphate synthase n=1 Tax=Tannockella kyphosi TaxID=2899121 RepID=UPI0020131EEE|nr:2-C-methyl-D-erythritol 2,4-cyclodiphosphate synthase [Tannockella kyphosi]
MYRIGQSIDIHQLVPDRKLILGGVEIPFEKGLLGHSDADVLVHAIIESVIGALGLGDIGTHFSDSDPQYAGIDSLVLLEKTYVMMKERGYVINNLDAIVLAEKPKLAVYIPTMRENISRVLCCNIEDVNIKATRGEKLGWIGEGLGMQAQAVVLLRKEGK